MSPPCSPQISRRSVSSVIRWDEMLLPVVPVSMANVWVHIQQEEVCQVCIRCCPLKQECLGIHYCNAGKHQFQKSSNSWAHCMAAGTGHAPCEHATGRLRDSKCNFAKLQTICNLNICKRYILTEGFQPLISVGGCVTASPLPLFQPNHARLWCCYKEQHCERTGFVQIVFRLQSNHSQIALRIKARKKNSRSISFRLNTRFCFGNTFSEGKEDVKRELSQHLLTPSMQPITYSPGFSPHSE